MKKPRYGPNIPAYQIELKSVQAFRLQRIALVIRQSANRHNSNNILFGLRGSMKGYIGKKLDINFLDIIHNSLYTVYTLKRKATTASRNYLPIYNISKTVADNNLPLAA